MAFVIAGAAHAGRFLDDFSTDTSANYIGTVTYGKGPGGFAVSNGVLRVDGSDNTTYDVFHRAARLEVGEAVRVVSKAGNSHDLYLTISTSPRGPNTESESGIRLNWTSGNGSFRARVYNRGIESKASFGGKVAVGTEFSVYIARTAEAMYTVGYDAGHAGAGDMTGITIEGTAGREIYVGVEKYASVSSFDHLEILDVAAFPVINRFAVDASSPDEPGKIVFTWLTDNAVATTLNGEAVTGSSTVRMVSEPMPFTLVATGRDGFSVSQTLRVTPIVDPCFPADRHVRQAVSVEERMRWPRKRIQQLEAERDRLLARISVLPQHDPVFLSTHLGYHSSFEESGSAGSFSPHQIDFKFFWKTEIHSIALAPAFNPRASGAYAFPKRFKIEVLDNRTGEFVDVVNWMEEDFPAPGPYPVFFSGINRSARQVRITVLPEMQKSGVAYFALGEVFLFRRVLDGRIGDNMATWGRLGIEVEASESFSMPPLWGLQYLHDGAVGFGFPLGNHPEGASDLMVVYGDETLDSDNVQLTLDLGRQESIGRIDFWPAGAPHLLALPSFGFPRKILMELSPDPGFKTVKVLGKDNTSGFIHRENPLSVVCEGYNARYIRITLEEFSEYKGKRILGLGEVSVSEYGQVLSDNCKVTAQGIPEEYMDQLPRLVDGYSRQCRILPQGEWIRGLAQRRPLDRRLAEVERELALAKDAWRRIKQRSGIWAGGIILVVLVGGLAIQQQMRKRGIAKLKRRIARDLHDDVGSLLGGISFSTEQLKHVVVEEEAKAGLCDLSLMASEACASLHEVVWVIDQSIIRLPMLIKKLAERADRVLRGAGLSVETSVECPDCVVSLTYKRHLIMFFKEVVHNCARHAKATRVWVDFSTIDQHLRISVRDNGCGFDPSKASDGWGLGSMKERAEEMDGEMDLTSRPGEGTSVVLTIPLAALTGKMDHMYKTSN